MYKMFIAVILLLNSNVYSQTGWTAISPLDYCPEYKIKYQVLPDGEYEVSIPMGQEKLERYVKYQIPNINNLSDLTDTIVESSARTCSDDLDFISFNSNSVVYNFEDHYTLDTIECERPYKFNPEYLNLMKDMVTIFQSDSDANKCAQVTEYIELQTKINQLREEDLIKPNKSRNLFHLLIKLFAGDTTDEMVNMFNTCGGRKGSDLFVTNSILLAARDSCIMPKPPGILSFEDAKNIARSVGSEYRKMSLMSLNKKQDEITQKATLAFVDSVIKEEVNGLIGPYMDNTDEFINGLSSYQELREMKVQDDSMDYISYGFSIDATLEVAKNAIPILVENSLKSKLPKKWSAERRKKFMKEHILPDSNKKYDECIEPYLDKLAYGQDNYIEARLKLKDQYCLDHPKECNPNSCDGSINLMSGNPEVKDSQIVQSCVMGSIFTSIKPLLRTLISDQKEAFSDSFDLSEEKIDLFSERTWDKLVSCANTKILNKLNYEESLYPEDAVLTDQSLLQNTQPSDFEEIVGICAEVAETSVSRDFVTQLLLNTDELVNAFPDKEMVERDGQLYSKTLSDKVDSIIRSSFDTCLAKQDYLINNRKPDSEFDTTNPLFCTPHIEMAAAKLVVEKTFNETFEQHGMTEDDEVKIHLKEFNNCTNEAQINAQNALGATRVEGSTPINNEEDANSYLEDNNDFYNCIETGIVGLAEIVTGKSIDKMAVDMKDKLANVGYLKSLKGDAQIMASQCFERELQKNAGSWKKFSAFNAENGLDTTQALCEQEVTEYILPKVMIKETGSLLSDIEKKGVIKNKTEMGNIIALTAYRLRKKYDIELPSHLKGDEIVEYSFAKAYNKHISIPGNSIDTFLAEYEEFALKESIENIHDYIKTLVNKKAAPNNYNDFFSAVSPKCIMTAYSKFQPEIAQFIDDMSKLPSDPNAEKLIDTIVTTIVDGVEYSKSLGSNAYQNQLSELSSICKNMSQYKSPKELADTGAFDFILKSTIQNQVIDSFEKIAIDQCHKDIKKLSPKASQYTINQACRWSDPYNASLARATLKNGTPNNIELEFVFERFKSMRKVIDDHLSSTAQFNKTVFGDNAKKVAINQRAKLIAAKKECQKKMIFVSMNLKGNDDLKNKICNPYYSKDTRDRAMQGLISSMNSSISLQHNFIAREQIKDTLARLSNNINLTATNAVNTMGADCMRKGSLSQTTKCMQSKNNVTDIIYDNFTDVLSNKKSAMDKINDEVVKRLFQDMSPKSFAYDFGESQLVNGLGVAGYDKARASITYDSIDQSVGFWEDIVVNKNKVVKKAKGILTKMWVPSKISDRFDWSGIDDLQRQRLIGSMYENVVKASATGGQSNDDKVSDDLTDHVENYIYSNGYTFEDSLTDDITEKIPEGGGIYGIE